jgi:hypothetical protein
MNKKRILAGLALVAAGALTLVGCSSGDTGGDAAGTGDGYRVALRLAGRGPEPGVRGG